jgi:diguanylate cyclase (GGDEF)-like protein
MGRWLPLMAKTRLVISLVAATVAASTLDRGYGFAVANRRAVQERAPLELKRARRAGVPVSLLLCDIDHFKNINDRHGHEAGDAVLRSVAATLRATVRETDLLGRWGGEEFLAVLVDADAGRAADVAERMRANVAATPLEGLPEPATISIGISTRQQVEPAADVWEALLKEADTQLYRAKSAGRNRVVTVAD